MASNPSTTFRVAMQLAVISSCSTPAAQLLGAAGSLPHASRGRLSAVWSSGPSLQATRSFSSRLSEMMTLPNVKRERSRTLQDVTTVSSLFLKNRSLYHPQFTPHGIQLLPKSLVQPAAASTATTAASPVTASATTTQASSSELTRAAVVAAEVANLRQQLKQAGLKLSVLEQWMDVNASGSEGSEELQAADKTKAWRRLKMKKHKINKRRKLNRYKTK